MVTIGVGVVGSTAAGGAAGQLLSIAIAALPASIGVGILKYRLYEIDRLISRTLAYAIVTGMLIGVYVGTGPADHAGLPSAHAGGRGRVHAGRGGLVQPLRRRVQHAVDRRFNRARTTPSRP